MNRRAGVSGFVRGLRPRCRAVAAGVLFSLALLPARAQNLEEQLASARNAGDRLAEIEVLSKIVEARPREVAARVALAEGWLGVGDAAGAARALAGIKNPPGELAALVEAGCAAETSPEKAREILETALAANPSWHRVRERLACLLMEAGEPGQAVALLARAPDARRHTSLGLVEARARRGAGDFHGAVATFRLLPKEDPTVQKVAPEFERLEAVLPALDETARVLARVPENLAARVERAAALASAGLSPAAAQEARAALEAHPASRAALLLAAREPPQNFWHPDLAMVQGGLPSGSSTRNQLVELADLDGRVASGNSSARISRARLLLAMRQPRLALEDTADTQTAEGLIARLEVLAALGQGREAAALAAGAGTKDRRLAARAWTLAAEALLNSWESARAEAAASRALELEGNNRRALELRAAARRRLNDEEGARADLAAAAR